MLRSDLCDHSHAHIVVKRTVTVDSTNANNWPNKTLAFKKNIPFRSRISKINNTSVDNVEDLFIVMLKCNLLDCGDNCSVTSCLWNYYRDEVNDNANENNADNYRIDNSNTLVSKSFEYKAKIMGNAPANNNTLDTEVVVPL